MDEQIRSRIRTGSGEQGSKNVTHNLVVYAKSVDDETRLIFTKSVIRIDLTRIIAPIILNTNLDLYSLVDGITHNLALDLIKLNSQNTIELLRDIIFNEIHRVAIQASIITAGDYANILNESRSQINDILNNIIKIML